MSKKDVKLSQNVKKKKKKNKRRLAKLMTVFIFAALALLIFQMIYLAQFLNPIVHQYHQESYRL